MNKPFFLHNRELYLLRVILPTDSTNGISIRAFSFPIIENSYRDTVHLIHPPLSYHSNNTFSNSVLSFAVDSLKVKHVIVLGHYGCGGVAAAMMPLGKLPTRPADIAIQSWISPIRDIYETSERYGYPPLRRMADIFY